MAIIICVDGIGGCPHVTFGELQSALGTQHAVVIADTSDVKTHNDRITRALRLYERACLDHNSEIYLAGQSAGGGAVRIVAEEIEKRDTAAGYASRLTGVILLSPAVPRFVLYLTLPLLKLMLVRVLHLLFGWTMHSTEKEFGILTGPMPSSTKGRVISNRTAFPGKETRELAFFPRKLRGYRRFRTLHVYGTRDSWIAPSAQEKLGRLLQKSGANVTTIVVEGAGHITLASEKRYEVIEVIRQWIQKAE